MREDVAGEIGDVGRHDVVAPGEEGLGLAAAEASAKVPRGDAGCSTLAEMSPCAASRGAVTRRTI